MHDGSISLELEELDVISEYSVNQDEKKPTQCSNGLLCFQVEHPLSDSHGIRYVAKNATCIPNFVGANLPRCDQGDWKYYCCTMVVLFKPWRQGSDLKAADRLWDEEFREHSFSEEENHYMRNFNVRYECLDVRDNYRAQLKKAGDAIIGSWDGGNGKEVHDDDFQGVNPDNIEFEDAPIDPLDSGPNHKRRMREMGTVVQMMTSIGWADPIFPIVEQLPTSFTPKKTITGVAWEQEIEKLKQKVQNKKNEHNIIPGHVDDLQGSATLHKPHLANIVKARDKSYLDQKFYVDGASDIIDSTVKEFSLNKEQEHTFQIIANHAVSLNSEQLRMYLGGMGGTGKLQVIKALSHFFTARKEAHCFIIMAPTGTAAALLGGLTYHSMFGINDRSTSGSRLGHVKARLEGMKYMFFDEVSMLSARDMYYINVQLAKVLENAHVPFSSLNMIFSGAFAQLLLAVGGENVSLLRSVSEMSTDRKSQEEAVGKALWHQVTTVVILHQNICQHKQSSEDTKF